MPPQIPNVREIRRCSPKWLKMLVPQSVGLKTKNKKTKCKMQILTNLNRDIFIQYYFSLIYCTNHCSYSLLALPFILDYFKHEYEEYVYRWGDPLQMETSWRKLNPEKRFLTYPQPQNVGGCNFFDYQCATDRGR